MGLGVAPALADSGSIRLTIVKGGWFLGAHGGSGVLVFHGRRYPLSVGGIDAGLVFGLSKTDFHGRVTHIRGPLQMSRASMAPAAPERPWSWARA